LLIVTYTEVKMTIAGQLLVVPFYELTRVTRSLNLV